MAESSAPWSVEYATEVMRHVDQQLTLGGPANLVSFRQNAVFHLPHRDVSVRIYGPERPELKAHLMLDVPRRLVASDVLAVRPADEFAAQPFFIHGAFVTIWHWFEAHE